MRTREALQVKKENGVTLGRPRSTPADVVARVVRERTEGKTAYAITRDLNKDAVPTAQDGLRCWEENSAYAVRVKSVRSGLCARRRRPWRPPRLMALLRGRPPRVRDL
jgi:hypothetical protein